MKAIKQFLFFLSLISSISVYSQISSDSSWHRLPSPLAASIRSFAESPDHILYAGTIAGVYKSIDKGESWQQAGLNEKVIDAILVTNKGTLLAGTYRAGIFRSDDQGKTWTPTGLEKNVYLFDILQVQNKTIFASAAYINGNDQTTPTGIFKSTDDGKTWKTTSVTDNNIVTLCNPKPELLIASGRSKFLRSLDNGKTWLSGAKGLPDSIPVSSVTILGKTLYASVGYREAVDVKSDGGIFRSEDNGLTWVRSDSGIGAGTKVSGIVSDGKTLFASTGFYGQGKNGVYKSNDKGKAWVPAGINEQSLRFIKLTSDKWMVAGTDGSALFISKDKGDNWKQSGKGMNDWVSISILKDKNYFYSLNWESGMWRSTDNGENWKKVLKNHQGATLLPNGKLLAFFNNEILASDNHGDTWVKHADFKGALVFLQYMNDTLMVACTDHGLFHSKDGGTSWNKYDMPGYNDVHFRTLLITPKGTMLTGYRIGQSEVGILRSDNGGKTWKKVNEGLHVWAFLNHEGAIYAGNYAMGMFKSTDDGLTWHPCNNGLRKENEYITVTAIISSRDQSIICSTLGNGAFRSTDKGVTWQPFNNGLTNFNNFNIFKDENDFLFITSFKGIFKRK